MNAAKQVVIFAFVFFQLWFTIAYLYRQPWWTSPVSRMYAIKAVLFSLIMGQAMIGIVLGGYWFQDVVQVALWGSGALVVAGMTWMLLSVQSKARKVRRDAGDFRHQWEIWRDLYRERNRKS